MPAPKKRVINLGERRKQAAPVEVTDGNGHTFQLARMLPASVTVDMMSLVNARQDIAAAQAALRNLWTTVFGSEHAQSAMDVFTQDEFYEILTEVYQVSMGESLASLTS